MSDTLLAGWWQVLAVLATAVIAAILAFWGIQSQRAIARRTLTLNHMSRVDNDADMIHARKIFIQEAKKAEGVTPWAEPGKEHSLECEAIRLVLNDFELVSVGIQLGIIDYAFYKRYNRSTVIRYWYAAAPFIYSIRRQTGSKALFHEFEELYRGFEKGRPPRRKFYFLSFR
jgi:hypothetical protein